MSNEHSNQCDEVENRIAEVLDGTAPESLYDHIADCDRCRDLRHDTERAADVVKDSAADYIAPDDIEARVLSALDARESGTEPAESRAPTMLDSRAGIERTLPSIDAGASEPGEDSSAPDLEPEPPPDPAPEPQRISYPEEPPESGDEEDTVSSRGGDQDAASPTAPGAASARTLPSGRTVTRGADRSAARSKPSGGPRRLLVGLGLTGLAAAAAAALVMRTTPDANENEAKRPWQGTVTAVSRAGGGGDIQRCNWKGEECSALAEGANITAGSLLQTDEKTRAVIQLEDGTKVALDRGTKLTFVGKKDRWAKLESGAVVAEVSPVEGSTAGFGIPGGRVEVLGTKLALRVDDEAVAVDVSRGSVDLFDEKDRKITVRAGEEGRLYPGIPPYAMAAPSLGDAMSWSEAASDLQSEEVEVRGLGELRAKKPGAKQELGIGAVRLASHKVKVRIVDNVARTEVDETFTNTTADVLEGIYRFPLPPDAKIERLALEVDGKLEEGAFVDRDRAAAIWRGAIVNAEPKAKKLIQEEIVWVPGPWKDPALLEWQRGGRFELRIYPIPKKGSRRVVIAYTQTIKPSGGVRRYTYPLAHDPSGSTKVDEFEVDIQVKGHDPSLGVRPQGYELAKSQAAGNEVLTLKRTSFVPSGDLVVEYALPGRANEVTTWAYQPEQKDIEAVTAKRSRHEKKTSKKSEKPAVVADAVTPESQVDDSSPYVAIALRPKLPRWTENAQRSYAIVVDSSRSMIGERYKRATELTARVVAEMDRNDRFTVLACDSVCRAMPGGAREPSAQGAIEARQFLDGVTPEGGSDVTAAVIEGHRMAGTDAGRVARVVYIGDGTPTVGAVHPAFIERELARKLGIRSGSVTAVAIGADSDVPALEAVASAGGGVVLPYQPGQRVIEAAFAILGATLGNALKSPELRLPDGLVAVAPSRLDTIPAGGESIVVARMTRPNVSGALELSGQVGDKPFKQTYDVNMVATTAKGNAFVPRLYAAARIAELERTPGQLAKSEAITLSASFNVASRYTSLLVLESEAMFKAFGLDNTRAAPRWTGESGAESSASAGALAFADESKDDGLRDLFDDEDLDGAASGSRGVGTSGVARGGGGFGRAGAEKSKKERRRPAPSPKPAPAASPPRVAAGPVDKRPAFDRPAEEKAPDPDFAPPPPSSPPTGGWPGATDSTAQPRASRPRNQCNCSPNDLMCAMRCSSSNAPPPNRWRGGRRMIPMRKVFERKGSITAGLSVPKSADLTKIAAAEEAHRQNPESRNALMELHRLFTLAGDVEKAHSLAERWSAKDPLDPEALTARADLAARSGDRDLAIRILGSVVDIRPDDTKSQWRLARLHRWAGRTALGCRFSMAVAQIRSNESKLLVEAVRCLRDTGDAVAADELLAAAPDAVRQGAERRLAKPARDPNEIRGDLKVVATWDGGLHDLDLALVHPDGHRVSWLGAPTRSVISARDVLSTNTETLALRGGKNGEYVIEVTRASANSGIVRGTVEVTAAGSKKSVPFVLEGNRLRLGTVKIRTESKLVPI